MSTPEQRLRRRISEEGPVPFADFMVEALYGDNGYYHREASPIGIGGDFVTGSSHSPLFGQATARLVRRLDRALGRMAEVLEVGFGSGRHLLSLREAVAQRGERRLLAFDRVGRALGPGIEIVGDLESLPEGGLEGLIFSYELFDALPVHRLIGVEGGGVEELWVDLDDAGGFRYRQRGLSDPDLQRCLGGEGKVLEAGQIADVSPEWGRLYERLARLLGRGLLVTCDYGYERRQLFDPRVRFHGTLACYRRQRVHRDALRHVGDQDLTAHVDFTTLRSVGEAAGLETIAWTRQARWLVACGIFEHLRGAEPARRIEALDLLDGAGMGEEIRVLVQGRGVEAATVFDLELLE